MKNSNIKNNNSNLKSKAYNLSDWYDSSTMSYFEDIFDEIYEQEDGKVKSDNVRNAIYTLNENIPLKSIDNKYYGIHSDFIEDSDQTILLIGKREFNNLDISSFSSFTESDIYFYNTNKNENLNNDKDLKISFVAGNNPDLFDDSPYIETATTHDMNGSASLSFNIINKDKINIKSVDGILINNIKIPDFESNDKIYLFVDDINPDEIITLRWDSISKTMSGSSYGSASNPLNFEGSLYVNGTSLEFTDNRKSNVSIGNLKSGLSFNNYSSSELLKRILYTYLPPTCRLKAIDSLFVKSGLINYVEVGTKANEIGIKYEIYKKTDNITSIHLVNMLPITLPPISNDDFVTVDGIVMPIIQTSGIIVPNFEYDFTLNAFDGKDVGSYTMNLTGVYPFYHSLTNEIIGGTYSDPVDVLTKLINGKSDIELYFNGDGKIYFSYPSEYGELNMIMDDNDDIIGNFTYSVGYYITDRWSKEYIQYESLGTYSFPDTEKIIFKF